MKALCFGEILWDVNGSERTLGGAPLNVAGHIRRLGGNSYMASAVGRDELGSLTLSAIDSLGVDRRLVHLSDNPTGIAEVTLSDGIPSYAFNDPAAWDDINMTEDDMSFLIGWSLYNATSDNIGEITDFMDIPGNPCIIAGTKKGAVTIPLHEDLIISIDPVSRSITMDIPDGLLSL